LPRAQSWEKLAAFSKIDKVNLNEDKSHEERDWLNDVTPVNIDFMVVAEDTFHSSRG
jgi:hypothetical protein